MDNSALLTDFYQLSMAYGYWQLGLDDQETVFHLFFRRMPKQGDYVVASGLQAVIDYLNQFRFTDDDIAYLKTIKNPTFSDEFLAYLKTLRFTGDIDAMPEGSIVFGNEPLLRIKASIILCQLLETPLINALNFSSAVATTATRMRTTAGNDVLFEFGLRRSQGPNGGLTASRAAYLGGFDATSNVLAGKYFDIPVVGTMAHSWVMSFDDELTAFEAYARLIPENLVLLVDTYNTMQGVDHAIAVGKKSGLLKGIRLDSGDLGALSIAAREKLNQAGLFETKIFVSGDITENRLIELKSMKAPIDGWGVGTHLSTSYDQPALDMVYKLGAIKKTNAWQYKLKISENHIKTSDPGILQVRRVFEKDKWKGDIIYHEDFGVPDCIDFKDLLIPIFRKGQLLNEQPSLHEKRQYCLEQVKQFNASKGDGYSVKREERLLELKRKLMR
ncbi:MAG: nicotinate phosphoribosyltransferase [Gammaproteobacteria bacterium RIFCSPHIGHO2_12_FULL_38_11]|nr:MAG: nicotinate phosphoribosyltransferase [Gammaproteobacteria bacterium RIFCSPHIGHO2_12_FULL_38_11]